jgi:hypothetical protein
MINLETMADFLRESGGTYNRATDNVQMSFQQFEKYTASIVGQTILDNNGGIESVFEKAKLAAAQRDELLLALKEARADVARVESGRFCDLRETLREIDFTIAKVEKENV